jgi:hypothetical protein
MASLLDAIIAIVMLIAIFGLIKVYELVNEKEKKKVICIAQTVFCALTVLTFMAYFPELRLQVTETLRLRFDTGFYAMILVVVLSATQLVFFLKKIMGWGTSLILFILSLLAASWSFLALQAEVFERGSWTVKSNLISAGTDLEVFSILMSLSFLFMSLVLVSDYYIAYYIKKTQKK